MRIDSNVKTSLKTEIVWFGWRFRGWRVFVSTVKHGKEGVGERRIEWRVRLGGRDDLGSDVESEVLHGSRLAEGWESHLHGN